MHIQVVQQKSTDTSRNNSGNIRHHASLSMGQPAMTQTVKVGKMKYTNNYFVFISDASIPILATVSALF